MTPGTRRLRLRLTMTARTSGVWVSGVKRQCVRARVCVCVCVLRGRATCEDEHLDHLRGRAGSRSEQPSPFEQQQQRCAACETTVAEAAPAMPIPQPRTSQRSRARLSSPPSTSWRPSCRCTPPAAPSPSSGQARRGCGSPAGRVHEASRNPPLSAGQARRGCGSRQILLRARQSAGRHRTDPSERRAASPRQPHDKQRGAGQAHVQCVAQHGEGVPVLAYRNTPQNPSRTAFGRRRRRSARREQSAWRTGWCTPPVHSPSLHV